MPVAAQEVTRSAQAHTSMMVEHSWEVLSRPQVQKSIPTPDTAAEEAVKIAVGLGTEVD
jgi:hypothetical protein